MRKAKKREIEKKLVDLGDKIKGEYDKAIGPWFVPVDNSEKSTVLTWGMQFALTFLARNQRNFPVGILCIGDCSQFVRPVFDYFLPFQHLKFTPIEFFNCEGFDKNTRTITIEINEANLSLITGRAVYVNDIFGTSVKLSSHHTETLTLMSDWIDEEIHECAGYILKKSHKVL